MVDAFGSAPSFSAFLASPTVAALVASAELATEAEGDPQVAPVAFSQEGMVWHEQLAPGSQSLPPLVRRYRGSLDVGVLGRGLAEIVRRHEPLRTTFELRQGRLVQVVAPPGAFRLSVKDVSDRPASGQDAELAKVLSGAARPFHLVDGPLFEATLVRFGAEDHVVVFKVHHSVYDDWSVSLFRRELSCLYRAFLAGEPSPLADLPVGFAEVSRAQRRRLAGRRGTDELSWWRRELRGAPLCLELPVDDPERPAGATQASAEPVSIELPNELSVQLRALARRERTTLFMTMLAAFQVLVERYTGQAELVLATVVANRNRSDLEEMIGCFTKKVLVRLHASGGGSFAQLLPQVRASVLGALSHQDLPFETVLQQTLGREAARHGLVPQVGVMFQGVTPQGEELVLPGLTTSGYDTSATTTRTHFASGGEEADAAGTAWGQGLYLGTFLILSLIESGETISLSARGAFHRPSVRALLANFETLLTEVTTHPSRRLDLLTLADGDQRAESGPGENDAVDIVARGSGTGCAHQLFEAQVEQTPSRAAMIERGRTLTYAEVDAEASKLAGRIQAGGVQPGALVGICLGPSVDAVVAVLGVWKSGAGFVALDPQDSDEHLRFVVEAASLGLVVTSARRGTHLRSRLSARGVEIEAMIVSGSDAHADSNPSSTTVPVAGDPAAPALVFFGSSPSGPGSGVVIEHRAVVNLAAGLVCDLYRAGPQQSAPSPLCVGLSASLAAPSFLRQMVAMLSGHTLRVMSQADEEAENDVLSHLRAGTVDLIDCSPPDLEELAGGGLAEALRERPGGARSPVVVVGSTARIDAGVWSILAALPSARAYCLYGSPECTFGAMLTPVAAGGGRITVGLPLAGVVAAILDPQGRSLPRRAIGELYLGGESLARGYLGGSRAVEGRFVSLLASEEPASRLLATGQLARRLPDGNLVALPGFRVDTARMEAALQRCPTVGQVAVVLREELPGEPNLVAYVVPSVEVAPTLDEMRRVLWAEMPGYAWPAALVVVERLPLLANGSVDLASLPASDFSIRLERNDVVASLWAEVLGVQQVQADENYWQSFSFLDVVARVREAGFPLGDRQVSRNRVLGTLHTDVVVAAGDLPDS
jgi:non-ribosomal peptide synthetase component F